MKFQPSSLTKKNHFDIPSDSLFGTHCIGYSSEYCSVLSLTTNTLYATEKGSREIKDNENKEFFKYRPQFDGRDYVQIEGSTRLLDSGKNQGQFEFCARYKGSAYYRFHNFNLEKYSSVIFSFFYVSVFQR